MSRFGTAILSAIIGVSVAIDSGTARHGTPVPPPMAGVIIGSIFGALGIAALCVGYFLLCCLCVATVRTRIARNNQQRRQRELHAFAPHDTDNNREQLPPPMIFPDRANGALQIGYPTAAASSTGSAFMTAIPPEIVSHMEAGSPSGSAPAPASRAENPFGTPPLPRSRSETRSDSSSDSGGLSCRF